MNDKTVKHIMTFALTVAATTLWAALPDPVVWYSMDALTKDGKVADLSGNGRDLTLGSGTALAEDGVSGKALAFDGSADAVATFSCLALKGRTISMWVRLDSHDGPPPSGVSSYRYYFDGVSTFNYRLYRASARGSQESTIGGKTYSLSSRWQLGEWVHMLWAIDYREATDQIGIALYENGCFRSWNLQARDKAVPIDVASFARLGNSLAGGQAFYGLIDEVKVYDKYFNEQEIVLDYKSSCPAPTLHNRWKMDATSVGTDGKSRVADETGRSPLVLDGCALATDPQRGTVLNFTGSSGSRAVATNTLNLSEYTFMAWIKQPASGTEAACPGNTTPFVFRSIAGEGSNTRTNQICLSSAATDFSAGIELAGTSPAGEKLPSAVAAKDRWYHLALVSTMFVNSSNRRVLQPTLYVDGERVAVGKERQVTSSVGLEPLIEFVLGNSFGSNPFFGQMDDVRIYRGALSAARIREVFSGCAIVDAGADFTVRRETARLMGAQGVSGMAAFQPVPGETVWTLVSAPMGGESATIRAPNCLSTDITLPVPGAYTFRLTVSGSEADTGNHDDVVVTRVEPTANMPPTVTVAASVSSVTQPAPVGLMATVSDADEDSVRLEWSKVSGPGGVWFEPRHSATAKAVFSAPGTYVLACTADDGAVRTTGETTVTVSGTDTAAALTDCLWGHWAFDGGENDAVSATRYTMQSAVNTCVGKVGNGICATNYDVYVGTQRECPGVDKLTFSWWMYDDMESALLKQYGANYTRLLYPCIAEPQYYGDVLIVPVVDSAGNNWEFTFGGMKNGPYGSLANRWAHCALVFDLSPYNDWGWPKRLVRLYVDGTEIEMTSYKGGVKDTAGKWNYVRKAKPAGFIAFVGRGWGLSGGQMRCFYGKMDEIRCYTNALTQAQLQRLVLDTPVVNRAPVAEIAGAADRRCLKRQSQELAGAAYDDGLSTPSAATFAWSLLSGNPEGIVLPASADGQVLFSKKGTYSVQLRNRMKIKTHSIVLKVGRVAPRPPHSKPNEIRHCIANAAAKGLAALPLQE